MKPHTTFNREQIAAQLQTGLSQFELPVDAAGLVAPLTDFLQELHKWNRAYNLTAVRDPAQMLTRHVYDSFSAAPFIHGTRVADIGTGAGLPGIPLALSHPQVQFTLVDSNGKKTRFVQHAVAHLGLANVTVQQVRAEAFVPAALFDTVICRAFSSLAEFINQCGHCARPGGQLVAMKGRYPEEELHALPAGWQLLRSEAVTVQGLEGERHLLALGREADSATV